MANKTIAFPLYNSHIGATVPILAIDNGGEASFSISVSGGGGGGATIAHTTNLIAGDGSGNGVDGGSAPGALATAIANSPTSDQKAALDAATNNPSAINPFITNADLGSAAFAQTGDFATSGQGTKADTAIQPSGDISGTVGINGDTSQAIDAVLPADTGWTANQSGGDKTVAVQNYTNGLNGTMIAALNVVSAGTGDALNNALAQIAALTKKLQAIETALANQLRPNA